MRLIGRDELRTPHRQRALHQRASTTRTAVTCSRTRYTLGLGARRRARRRDDLREFLGDAARRGAGRRCRQPGAHRAGHGARAPPADRRRRLARPPGARRWRASSWPSAPTSRPREPLGEERARALITNNAAVADMNWILDYFRRSADHRLLFGGRVSYSGIDPFDSARVLRTRIAAVFPQLTDARIEYAWGGYLDITLNRAPHFGRLGPNAYFLQGLVRPRHGDLRHRRQTRERSHRRHRRALRHVRAAFRIGDFPGGTLFRRPALVLAMLWFRSWTCFDYAQASISSCGCRRCRCCWSRPRSPGCCRCRCAMSSIVDPLWSLMLFAAGVDLRARQRSARAAAVAGVVAAGAVGRAPVACTSRARNAGKGEDRALPGRCARATSRTSR